MVWKGKKEGRYQRYYFSFLAIGTIAFIMGAILPLVSLITDLLFDYALFLTSAGALSLIIGLFIWNRREKTR